MKFTKKGAMFGIDARIALAIFGTLSVITGASLFSAIKDAKVVAIITEMNNIGKALEEYRSDVGIYPPMDSGGGYLAIEKLIEGSGVSDWNGPYLTYLDGPSNHLDHPIYKDMYLLGAVDVPSWTPPISLTDLSCERSDDSCSIFVCVTEMGDNINKSIDLKVDGVANDITGKYRYTGVFGCLNLVYYEPKESSN